MNSKLALLFVATGIVIQYMYGKLTTQPPAVSCCNTTLPVQTIICYSDDDDDFYPDCLDDFSFNGAYPDY